MKITIFVGENCPKCPAAKAVVKEFAAENGYEVEEIDLKKNLVFALQNQIVSTPSILVNGEVVFRSKVPTKEELLKAIKEVEK